MMTGKQPFGLLAELAEKFKIPFDAFERETTMWVSKQKVSVSIGRKPQCLYNNPNGIQLAAKTESKKTGSEKA